MPKINTKERLDTAKILNNLLSKLSPREKDVLGRRFGLNKKERETLKKIGEVHNLTRERVRQVESSGVNKIKKLKEIEENLEELKSIATRLLQEHGGVAEKNYLLKLLSRLSETEEGPAEEGVLKNRLEFLLSKLLDEEIEEIKSDDHFLPSYKIREHQLDHLQEIGRELVAKIEELKSTQKTRNLFELLNKLNAYHKHKDKLHSDSEISISDIIQQDYPEEEADTIDKNKPLYSLLHASRYLDQNKFGYWGLHNWSEVKPKKINDKIYLILKYYHKPMHFEEIAEEINRIGFDNKMANPATIHNELILDEKYVLVGRGIYGLKEWGYKRGVVVDVIKEILKQENKPLTKEEIVEKVLENRLVKRTTVNLALMNRDVFEKTEDGKYRLKK